MSKLMEWVAETKPLNESKATEAYYDARPLAIEKGRYTLVWLPACPRAHRTAISLKMLGLDAVIDQMVLLPHRDGKGWHLPDGRMVKDFQGSQPFLLDKHTGTVATNDQYNLSVLFAKDWQAFHAEGSFDFYPEAMRETIDRMSAFIYAHINVQIYRAAYSPSDKFAAETAKLFATWELLEAHLAENKFLLGDTLTDADLRLFPNLLRYEIYYTQFGLNRKHLHDFPHLLRYTKAIYALPEVAATTDLEAIVETHYRSSHNLAKFTNRHADETAETSFSFLK